MLSYQHIYHAGNFADVHKHALLVRVLQALRDKSPSFCVVDTHAGRGLYDLSASEALKTREFENGIERLSGAEKSLSLSGYLDALARHAPLYPGSAALARDHLRPQDRLIAAEMHPGEYRELVQALPAAPNLELVQDDGYAVLARSFPARERRGLAVIDPPYEVKTEYIAVPRAVEKSWKAWPQATFLIWYPILSSGAHDPMLTTLRLSSVKDVLISEIRLPHTPAQGFAMYGSGVAIVNPPVEERAIADLTASAATILGAQSAVFWLANCRLDPDTGALTTPV